MGHCIQLPYLAKNSGQDLDQFLTIDFHFWEGLTKVFVLVLRRILRIVLGIVFEIVLGKFYKGIGIEFVFGMVKD